MPIRAFVTQGLEQLQTTIAALEMALQTGSIEELRVAGILTRTAALSPQQVQLRYNQARYEAYLRVKEMCRKDPSKHEMLEQYPNPYLEKGMKVHSRSSVGVFGYPLPAPLVPPSP